MREKIKTKDMVKGTIKQLDRAAIVSDRMRRAYIQTKDKAEHSTNAAESNPEEYASDRIESGAQNIVHETGYQAKKLGKKGLHQIKDRVVEGKADPAGEPETSYPQDSPSRQTQRESRCKTHESQNNRAATLENTSRQTAQRPASASRSEATPHRAVEQGRSRAIKAAQKQRAETSSRVRSAERRLSHPVQQGQRQIKETARSAGKKTIKTAEKGTAKAVRGTQKTVKTAERTAKTAIKTSKEVEKIAEKSARATAKAAQKAAQAARATAKAAVTAAKAAAKAVAAAVKAIIAATKALITAIAAGGWVAVLVIVIIMLVALIACSVFGIFFSGEDSGTGLTMPMVVQEINADYDARLEEEKAAVSYDNLEMSGSRAVWKEVLAVYAVKTNTDPNAPQEVATMDDSKKQLLSDIFWEMNEISSHTETSSETVLTETDDGEGNIIETETTVTTTTLYITVSHKTVDEMTAQYGFTQEQKEYLAELLKDENNSLWAAVLYGIGYCDDQIVAVALSQLGNYGGMPYWSWYGFGSRVEWCACFVSWCANECGYIDNGIIPKYAGCGWGVQWFKDRGQWLDGDGEPVPGMIIFFDWDDENGQDGESDHTGIVEKVENGIVYTVEGNSGDHVAQRQYSVGYYEILGYGMPQY